MSDSYFSHAMYASIRCCWFDSGFIEISTATANSLASAISVESAMFFDEIGILKLNFIKSRDNKGERLRILQSKHAI